MAVETPEHDKLRKINDGSQAVGDFLDSTTYTLCEHVDEADLCGECGEPVEGYVPVRKPLLEILADHYGIDLDKLEVEKRAMLDELRRKEKQDGRK